MIAVLFSLLIDLGFPSVCCEYVLCNWLLKNLLWSMAGQNIASQEIQEKIEENKRQNQRDAM